MSEIQANNPGKPLKEQYVPFEERKSQKITWIPFAWETAKFFIVAKLSAVAGTLIGEYALKMPTTKIGRFYRQNQGTFIGAVLGGTYEMYAHWRKVKSQQLGVKSINSDLLTALDPVQLEKEAAKQAEILEGIAKIQQLHAGRSASHTEAVLARREANSEKTLS
jgi:hypothetical protein